jgi:hypothetical protein
MKTYTIAAIPGDGKNDRRGAVEVRSGNAVCANAGDEQHFFNRYLAALQTLYGANSPIYQAALNDPRDVPERRPAKASVPALRSLWLQDTAVRVCELASPHPLIKPRVAPAKQDSRLPGGVGGLQPERGDLCGGIR